MSSLSPMSLVLLALEAGYRQDPDGRLVESTEENPSPAPRVFVARTSEGVLHRVRVDVPSDEAAAIEAQVAQLPPLEGAGGDPSVFAELEGLVERRQPIADRFHGLAFVFAAPSPPVHPDVVEITDDRSALHGQFERFRTELDHVAPFFAILRDGQVVSACYSARTGRSAAEAGVDTDPEHRGRGYAAAVVNAWRRAVEDDGRIPLYSTWYENASSRKVADRLGLRQFAETLWLK